MTTLKIEHADPNSSAAIAFDVMGSDDAIVDTHILHFGEHALVPAGAPLRPVSGTELAKRQAKAAEDAEREHKRVNDAAAKAAGGSGEPNPAHVDLRPQPARPATGQDHDDQQRFEAEAESRDRAKETAKDEPKQEKPGLAGRKAHEQAKRANA